MSQKHFDFIGVGGIAYDLILRLDELPGADGKYPVHQVDRQPGGLVANTTAAAARLGLNAGYVGWIGQDSGAELLIRDFEQRKINTAGLLQIADEETPFTVITVDKAGQRAILLPPFPLYQASITPEQEAYIQQGTYVYTSFRSDNWCYNLANLAHNMGHFFVLDIEAHNHLDAQALCHLAEITDILFLSQGVMEAAQIGDIQEIKSRLWTIITLGSEGSLGYDSTTGEIIQQPAYPITPVDTTGAGDVFHAACIAAHHAEKSLKQALEYGSAAAAIALQHHGARGGLPAAEQVETWIQEHR